jgi:hypothetical protein
MDVLGINFRPDVTQIIEGKIKKNQLLVQDIQTMPSICPVLDSMQQENVTDFFSDIMNVVKKKRAVAFLGLSNEHIKKIKCSERNIVLPDQWEQEVYPWMAQQMQLDYSDYYICTPLKRFTRNENVLVTGMAIRKTYVDLLYNAALTVNMEIRTIEASSFALLRFLNCWDKEQCLLEIWENRSSIIGYSSIFGMFKVDYAKGWKVFAENQEELERYISSHDYTAFNDYKVANNTIPMFLVTNGYSALAGVFETLYPDRLMRNRQTHPYVKGDIIADYAALYGLALNPLRDKMLADLDEGVNANADAS